VLPTTQLDRVAECVAVRLEAAAVAAAKAEQPVTERASTCRIRSIWQPLLTQFSSPKGPEPEPTVAAVQRREAAARQRRVQALLIPSKSGEPPQLLQNLCVGGEDAVPFVHFWQVLHEINLQLRWPPTGPGLDGGGGGEDDDDEPVAFELSNFRDVLLRHCERGDATWEWLAEWTAACRNMSVDAAAWESLEAGVAQVASIHASSTESLGSSPALYLDEASALIVPWLQELTEDYRRGSRGAKLFCVRDVGRCSNRSACLHLSRTDWDVEAALRGLHMEAAGDSSSGPTSAWSSGGARLKKDEHDCPICVVTYHSDDGSPPIMTHCCFQVLCATCHHRLTDVVRRLSCPFCRSVSAVPIADLLAVEEHVRGGGGSASSSKRAGPRRLAGRAVRAVRGFAGELTGAVTHAFNDQIPSTPLPPTRERRISNEGAHGEFRRGNSGIGQHGDDRPCADRNSQRARSTTARQAVGSRRWQPQCLSCADHCCTDQAWGLAAACIPFSLYLLGTMVWNICIH